MSNCQGLQKTILGTKRVRTPSPTISASCILTATPSGGGSSTWFERCGADPAAQHRTKVTPTLLLVEQAK